MPEVVPVTKANRVVVDATANLFPSLGVRHTTSHDYEIAFHAVQSGHARQLALACESEDEKLSHPAIPPSNSATHSGRVPGWCASNQERLLSTQTGSVSAVTRRDATVEL